MAYVAATFAEVNDVRALAQLVSEEFGKIEDELAAAQGGATLIQDQPLVLGTADIIPSILTGWNTERPNRDFRSVLPSLATSQIVAARAGQYIANFTVTAEVELNRAYELRMYINGVATNLLAVADPSNQTDIVTMVATGTARVLRESDRSVLELRVSADQDGATFNIKESYFSVAWVGD